MGEETFRVASEVVDEMVTVGADEICQGIKNARNLNPCHRAF